MSMTLGGAAPSLVVIVAIFIQSSEATETVLSSERRLLNQVPSAHSGIVYML